MAGKGEGPAIGIDLGTTYSCVGVWQHDRVEIIANDQGNRTTPSYVAFTDSERLIGDAAENQVAMNPINTVFDAKRLIGRRVSDASVQSDMKLWPFKIIAGPAEKPMIVVNYKGEDKQFAAEENHTNQRFPPPPLTPRSQQNCKARSSCLLPLSIARRSLDELPKASSNDIRESLFKYLSAVLGNDYVAAHFMLLHLLSKVQARVDAIAVEKLLKRMLQLGYTPNQQTELEHLVQLWLFERFPILAPTCPNQLKKGEPRAARWHKLNNSETENAGFEFIVSALESKENFRWRPYVNDLKNWCFVSHYKENEQFVVDDGSNYGLATELRCFGVGLCADEIFDLECVEKYMPYRVAMQFGMDQDVPPCEFTTMSPSCKEKFSLHVPAKCYKPYVSLEYHNWWKKSKVDDSDMLDFKFFNVIKLVGISTNSSALVFLFATCYFRKTIRIHMISMTGQHLFNYHKNWILNLIGYFAICMAKCFIVQVVIVSFSQFKMWDPGKQLFGHYFLQP